MKELTNRTLATVLAVGLVCGSASIALADKGGNGNGHDHENAHANSAAAVHGNSAHMSSAHGNSAHGGNGANRANGYNSTVSSARGNSGTAHDCINPAGQMRGWCKSHAGGDFIRGTVTAINGNLAAITLSNGQIVNINDQYLLNQGRGLTVGQQVTLRGYWQNGVFVVNNGRYNNYGGPYSSASVRGLIISANGNSIQIAQGFSLITVNDSNAVARGAINGSLFPGRTITAFGSWNGSTFYANRIQ